jgi:dUTP pyrophosphatase
MNPKMYVKKLFEDAKLPVRANPTDSGADVFAYNMLEYYSSENKKFIVSNSNNFFILPNDRVLIGTGLSATVGVGYEIQVRSKSGMTLKSGITVLNSPGTIDESFTGQISVILFNHSKVPYKICIGDKIAQLVVCQVILSKFEIVDELAHTDRGNNGFGSSGIK